MANSSTSTMTYRQISISQPPPVADDEPKIASPKPKFAININLSISCPFNIPSTQEAAAIRVLKNLNYFNMYYIIFIWVVLFITLIPKRKLSLIILLIATNFTVMYLLVLKAMPSSRILHKWMDKRLILGSMALATGVLMILTNAGLHLLFTLLGTTPIILVHAILHPNESLFLTQITDVAGENFLDTVV